MLAKVLCKRDIERLRESGRDPDRIMAQLESLNRPAPRLRVSRPATLGDGIRSLDGEDVERLGLVHDEAAAAGRLACFVPASGSGTRLFKSLLEVHGDGVADLDELRARAAAGGSAAKEALRVLSNIERFPFWERLRSLGCTADDPHGILACLLDERGLTLHRLPKGLIPFHGYPERARTPFEEQLIEAALLCRDGSGRCAAHFTVPDGHRRHFEALLAELTPAIERDHGVRLEATFSVQRPETDTVATDRDGNLLRDRRGHVVFRPGGHGALLANLQAFARDVVLIKNIDNVVPLPLLVDSLGLRKSLTGLLLGVQARVHDALRALRAGAVPQAALDAIRDDLGLSLPDPLPRGDALTAFAVDRLDRPLRVCGMVPAEGHEGGGPFWARVEDGPETLQIVEQAQLDLHDPDQAERFARSTHFNPVLLACAVCDPDGKLYDLAAYADPTAEIVAEKSYEGRPIRALELPGLWNGAMARWNTIFVEIPRSAFNPVKTIADLLDEVHQAGRQ